MCDVPVHLYHVECSNQNGTRGIQRVINKCLNEIEEKRSKWSEVEGNRKEWLIEEMKTVWDMTFGFNKEVEVLNKPQ